MATHDSDIGTVIVLSMCDAAAALSNLAVVILILRKDSLRTVSNILVAALALSELFITVVVIPLSIIAYGKHLWSFHKELCVFQGYIFNTLFLVSGTLTSVISVDRFYSLASPMGHVAHLSEKTVVCMIVFVLANAGFWSSFPLYGIGNLEYIYLPNQTRCDVHWTLGGNYGLYYFVLLMVSFVLPLIGMTLMYFKSFQSAKESARKIRPGNIQIQTLQDGQFTSVARQESFDYLKANITVFIIIGSFVLSRGPNLVCNMAAWAQERQFCTPSAQLACSWLMYMSSLTTPYVYTLLNRRLRKELVQAIKAMVRCNQPSADDEPKDILDYLRNITDNYVTTDGSTTTRSRLGSATTSTQTRPSTQSQRDNQQHIPLQQAQTPPTAAIQEIQDVS